MSVNVDALADTIIKQAVASAGATWNKIRNSAPHFIRAYAQTLASIAAGVVRKEISLAKAKELEKNARLLLVMGIANTAQIVLAQAQKFINGAIAAVKAAINKALPIALL